MLPGLLAACMAPSLCHADSVCHPLVMETECQQYLQRIRDSASVDEATRIEAQQRALINERERLCPICAQNRMYRCSAPLRVAGAKAPPAIKAHIRY
jgi:hypothetical protein